MTTETKNTTNNKFASIRRLAAIALGTVALAVATVSIANGDNVQGGTATAASQEGEYNRLILIKFSPDATGQDIQTVKDRFCALGRSYKGLEEAVWIEDKELCEKSAYTHAVMLRFSCPVAAASYREHPQCQAFAKESPSIIASQLEMKYEVNGANRSGPSV